MNKIRVLLADDHPVARAGIRNFINKDLEIEVIGEADNGETALQLVIELKPDVLLLDMEMPGLKRIDVAKELKEKNSPVKILVLSSYNDKQYIFGLLSNGAASYLTKEEVPDRIIEAIQGVARGESGWLSCVIRGKPLRSRQPGLPRKIKMKSQSRNAQRKFLRGEWTEKPIRRSALLWESAQRQ